MTHALASFIREQMNARGLRNRDVERLSGLTKQVVSKHANDTREVLTRLPAKATIEGFARAFNVSPEFVLGKAAESLGLGYTTGDFVNSVSSATSDELVDEIRRRLEERDSGAHTAPIVPIGTNTDTTVTELSDRRSTLHEDERRVAKQRPRNARQSDEDGHK